MDLGFLNIGEKKGKDSNNNLVWLILLGVAFFAIRRYPALNIFQGLNLSALLGGNNQNGNTNNPAEYQQQYEESEPKNHNRKRNRNGSQY